MTREFFCPETPAQTAKANFRKLSFCKPCLAALVLGLCFFGADRTARAEDTNRLRPYFAFRSGDLETLWNVDDHQGFNIGLNINKYLGVEFALDYYLRDWPEGNEVAELSSFHFIPELRLRYPLMKDRLVPYALLGFGGSWIQSKDVHPWAFGQNPDAQGWTYTAAFGAGLEYYLADNIAFEFEVKYLLSQPIEGHINGQVVKADPSAPLFTYGFRVFFDENHPRPLVSMEADPVSRFYFGVRLGGNTSLTENWMPGVQLQPEQAAWGRKISQYGGLMFGTDFGQNLGFEVTVDSVNRLIATDALGDVAEYGQGWIMGNLRLRFPYGRWVPYATIGAGVVYVDFKDPKVGAVGRSLPPQAFYPAVGAGAGVEYFLVRNLSFCADFRFGYSFGHTFSMPPEIPQGKGDISYLAAAIGFRIYLAEW
jgi:opacity protein-like surface antigen